jgi:hypothetical protein
MRGATPLCRFGADQDGLTTPLKALSTCSDAQAHDRLYAMGTTRTGNSGRDGSG